jgi:hypothetical protein
MLSEHATENAYGQNLVARDTRSNDSGFEFTEIESRVADIPPVIDPACGCSHCAGCDGCGGV